MTKDPQAQVGQNSVSDRRGLLGSFFPANCLVEIVRTGAGRHRPNSMTDLFAWSEAQTLRDQGMALAADAQESEAPGFSALAYAAIEMVARRQTEVHVDDVLAECPIRPAHPNAYGSVWLRAIRNRIIERTGTVRPCRTDARKHSHNYPVYRSLVVGC